MAAPSQRLLYLDRKTVESLEVTMKQVVLAVDEGFKLKGRGETEMPAKIGVHSAPDSFLHAMPAYVKGADVVGIKWVGGYPANPSNALPYITGLLVLNDTHTGLPLALMDCAWITAMRTGASAAVAAKYLARPDSTTAAFVGCGVQARTSLRALVEVLKDLREIQCFDLHEAAVKKFIAEMGALFPSLLFSPCRSAQEAVREADVAVTAIPIVTEPKPMLEAGLLKAGGLAVSLDFDSAWTGAAMRECTFTTDDAGQLHEIKSHGVYFKDIPQKLHADLGELAAGTKPGRSSAIERIFAMNMGIAIDDMMTAKILYQQALKMNKGLWLDL
jgi:ornithine cyclodeaminase/alanine dehydrogenase